MAKNQTTPPPKKNQPKTECHAFYLNEMFHETQSNTLHSSGGPERQVVLEEQGGEVLGQAEHYELRFQLTMVSISF